MNKLKQSKLLVASLLSLAMVAIAPSNAYAAQNPAGCTNNDFVVNIGKSTTFGYDQTNPLGPTTVTYTVSTGNPNTSGTGCNVTGIEVVLTTPDGTPHLLQTGASYPIGTAVAVLGTVNYDINSADVTSNMVTASVHAAGKLQDNPSRDDNLSITKEVSVDVIYPSTLADISASAEAVVSGGTVDLAVTETNNGDTDLSNVYVEVDNGIGTLSAPPDAGDDGDEILQPGEVWSWTVHDVVVTSDTTFTATGHGTDFLSNDITAPNFPDEQSDVTVYVVEALEVSKTVETSYNRQWTWELEKTADHTSLVLDSGELGTVNYTVEVTPTSEDVDHAVSGEITITNPNLQYDATIESVSDVLDSSGGATVDCGVSFPYVLAADSQLICSYTGGNANDTENNVEVTTSGLIPGGEDTKDVTWGEPNDIVDECINLSDTNPNFPQGTTICAGDESMTVEYQVTFGADNQEADVALECGESEYPNTASFVTNDTEATGSSEWTVFPSVNCSFGCTLTQGYWKTHSSHGPAPYDSAWESVGGADMSLLGWSISWYDAFNTAPKRGDVWYQLAHQWMAATLNVNAGASVPDDVQQALDDAEAWLSSSSHDPKNGPYKDKTAGAWATLLDNYNNGLVGPGHCEE